jgi:hypothetical protein
VFAVNNTERRKILCHKFLLPDASTAAHKTSEKVGSTEKPWSLSSITDCWEIG